MVHPSVEPDALAFFCRLSGRLYIELSEPPQRIHPPLENLGAAPTASIVSIRLRAQVFERETGTFRPLSEEELDRVVIREPKVAFVGHGRGAATFDAPDGVAFRVRDLLAAVEETERRSRGDSEWYGGIDVHHVFFEGIHLGTDGQWRIRWGS